MEQVITGAVIFLVLYGILYATYWRGSYVQRKTDETLIDHYRAEIARLQQSEDDLRGSLYHRIGYQREQPKPEEPKDLPAPNNSVDDKEHKSHGFPDLFNRRHEAFAEDHKKMKELQRGQ